MHRRNREERFTVVALFSRILGDALGVKEALQSKMLQTYRDTLFEDIYTPAYAALQRRLKAQAVAQKTRKKSNDEALLKKLEKLTVKDEELSQKKTGPKRK